MFVIIVIMWGHLCLRKSSIVVRVCNHHDCIQTLLCLKIFFNQVDFIFYFTYMELGVFFSSVFANGNNFNHNLARSC